MTDLELRESQALVLPSGVIVSLSDAKECAHALQELRELENRVRDAKRVLTDAIVQESRRQGSKTIHLRDDFVAEVKDGKRLIWDVQRLEDGLRDLGMPEERIREMIVETVSYDVKAHEANRAARANEDYASLIASCRHEVEGNPTVSVRKR